VSGRVESSPVAARRPSDRAPALTVVVPAYQAAEVLPACLASIAAQTRPPDEVIVVDDGSSDGTAEVARAWASHLPVTVLRSERNEGAGLGAGAARRRGIEHACGELIALVDADDVWFPDHLAAMCAVHREHGGLVTADHLYWVPGERVGGRPASQLVPVPPPDHQPTAILTENFVFISVLFSRDLYDRAGPFRSMRCEDWDLWIRMVRAGARVHMPPTVTALYRQAPASVSAADKLLIGDVALLEELLGVVDDDERPHVERALRRRRAKLAYLEGLAKVDEGDVAAGRRAWVRAIRLDPSLRQNNSRMNGRVAVRAAACIVAPTSMAAMRRRRTGAAHVLVGDATGPRRRHA
jgi:glycosyltransferase involved in cell wall biosynthesis